MPETLTHPPASALPAAERRADGWRAVGICGFLVLAVLLVFCRTLNHGFLNYDDPYFIFAEPHVSGGLSWSGIAWAFTNGPYGEWYPLSMLSHMLDCQVYGLHPAGHHLTNVLLHAASAVTLFLVLWRMTESLWPSAMVAALFALHPLHVESVAWVSERRDVLSGWLFMLTLGAYAEYVRRPQSPMRYLAVVGLFVLGLLAKPMLVTLPPLLLVLDYWPLRRIGQTQPQTAAPSRRPAPFPWRVIVEKLPLFGLAIGAGVVTMRTHSPFPIPLTLSERLEGGAVSCVAYLGQLFVPIGLSPIYSHPEAGRPAWQVAAAVVLLLAITAAAVIGRRSNPSLFVGWFWYVGMLVPVLGLTYVGPEARADRYTYLSQIGLYIALVWAAMRIGAAWPARRWVFGIGSALALAGLMACTWRQAGYWQDDRTLWEHALACDPKSVTAHNHLGTVFEKIDEGDAAAQYRLALEIGPNERNIYNVIRARANYALGNIAARKGDFSDAIAHYQRALESYGDFAPAHLNLGRALAKTGDFNEARIHFQRCIELAPDSAAAYGNLAILFVERGEIDEAIAHLRRVIEIDPDAVVAYQQMAQLLRGQGKPGEAAQFDERGRKASRRFAEARNRQGIEFAQQGKTGDAIAQFQTAIAAVPDDALTHCNLADALALQGNVDDAISHYRRALEIDPNSAPAKRGLQQLSHH